VYPFSHSGLVVGVGVVVVIASYDVLLLDVADTAVEVVGAGVVEEIVVEIIEIVLDVVTGGVMLLEVVGNFIVLLILDVTGGVVLIETVEAAKVVNVIVAAA